MQRNENTLYFFFIVLVSKYFIVFMRIMKLHYTTHRVMVNQSIITPKEL